ncbi:MAG TPA: hypothetical protein DDZ42_00980 [Candidatus Rokubacteria bacterium]|nr:MAG: hypothetical protein A2050_03750 [Candidatus Rokubacteria bacterium GWA2_73_35]HBH00483.1 hypothetical protein [Candidatus Rokubacteria bacterium]
MPAIPPEAAVDLVRDVLAREGACWVREASPSMAPLIRPGDELCLAPAVPGRVGAGAVVGFRRGGLLVVHRVLARTPAFAVTKGDALGDPDAPVGWADVVGRVVALRTPEGRHVGLVGFPWPLLDRALALLATMAARFEPGGLAWKALRAPFHLVARGAR